MSTNGTYPSLAAKLAALPPRPESLRSQIASHIRDASKTTPILVALDDDPTGTQTCHDVPVLTTWNVDILTAEFRRISTTQEGGFFILTNSRALHPGPARSLIQEICNNLVSAASAAGVTFEVVLRGDSTLRGHFPLEPEVAQGVLGEVDAWLLCPYFLQGGRYTIDDVHYVADGDTLVPSADTPFAKDATFGYASSNLRDYVVEKGAGKIDRGKVSSIGLETIRQKGVEGVLAQFQATPKGSIVVINAVSEEDLDIVVMALLRAREEHGKRYIYRTGAAFVSSRLGISPIAPITGESLHLRSDVGGLIIAGSYVPKTTEQLASLRSKSGDKLNSVIIDVKQLLQTPEAAGDEVARAVAAAEAAISSGQDVLIMTSRELVTGADETESLNIGATVAKVLVDFLTRLSTKPRYVIAKGGITSSDMATKGLGMRRAMIIGQAAAGVPLWRCDEPASKWPGLPYVVFPGNVGSADTLFELVKGWRP